MGEIALETGKKIEEETGIGINSEKEKNKEVGKKKDNEKNRDNGKEEGNNGIVQNLGIEIVQDQETEAKDIDNKEKENDQSLEIEKKAKQSSIRKTTLIKDQETQIFKNSLKKPSSKISPGKKIEQIFITKMKVSLIKTK